MCPRSHSLRRRERVGPENVLSMTLTHYDETDLHITADGPHVIRGRLWGRAGSRCRAGRLATSTGRWQLTWRQYWTFA